MKKIKSYTIWHKLKAWLHNENPRVFFHESEIWFCHIGENVGFEQDGRGENFLRPVIIVRKFNNQVFWALPLTKTVKAGQYYFPFSFQPGETSTAILSQIRLLDAKRLKYKAGSMQPVDFTELKARIKQLLK